MAEELSKVSYSLGVSIARNLQSQGLKGLDINEFTEAVQDVFTGKPTKIDEKEVVETLNAYFSELQKEQQGTNKEDGEAFLVENKSKSGVISLPSGLQYSVMVEGKGEKPNLNSNVTTHYHGTTIDGNVFDSSVQRGQPASFPVSGVIKGWTEALQLMEVGAKWKLFIPSELAYGDRGAGADIGPHSALIFEVELLSID
ncbi:MAG: FKBP-type peptidyl-prolyl cis-trans isomerase [Cyclobacteriaceae bacterium]|nr:FKBP-type peptidyl-prolyl cis-trans isomerase [Cyclobacteriaceae bacterium]